MHLGIYSSCYLFLFIPIIGALVCQIFNNKNFGKNLGNKIAIFCVLSLILLTLKLSYYLVSEDEIANDFVFGILSIGLEFNLNFLSLIFLGLISFINLISLILFQREIALFSNSKEQNIFYSMWLLKMFGINGILISDQIFNLYFFIEIFALAHFAQIINANSTQPPSKSLILNSFQDFCLGSATSILILLCFLAVYLVFNETKLSKIANKFNNLTNEDSWFLATFSIFLIFALIAKFFPFWQIAKNTKIGYQHSKISAQTKENKNSFWSGFWKKENLQDDSGKPCFLADFLKIDMLFIKFLLGIFLLLKLIFFFFGREILFKKYNLDSLLILAGSSLTLFSIYRINRTKNLKLICALLCLENIGLIFLAISLQSQEALESILFFLINFVFLGLMIFMLSIFGNRCFEDFSLNSLSKINNSGILTRLTIFLILILLLAPPFGFQFFGYWLLLISALKPDLSMILILVVFICGYSQMVLCQKLYNKTFVESPLETNLKSSNSLGSLKIITPEEKISFVSLIFVAILCLMLAKNLQDIAANLASFLLNYSA